MNSRADTSSPVKDESNNDTNTTSPTSVASLVAAGKKRKSTASSRGVASLTPEQLEKKRANDREAQRAIRERTKNQIETLENRIRELESQQPFQELQAILRQKQAVQAENEEIKRRLNSILAIIQPVLGASGLTELASSAHSHVASDVHRNPSHTSLDSPGYPQGCQDAVPQSATFSDGSMGMDTPSPRTGTGHRRSYPSRGGGGPPQDPPPWAPFDSQKNNLTHGLEFGGPGEKLGLGFLLDPSHQVTKLKDIQRGPDGMGVQQQYGQYQGQQTNSLQDTPLVAHAAPTRNISPTCPLDGILLDFLHSRQRELAEGASSQRLVGPAYPSVSSLLNPDKSIYSHPLSKVFTDILSKFPDISALPEQVGVLYIMFLIMRWQIYPTQENYDRLPEWATPRPSQLFTPHPAWLDYLPWPRMRDKMVATYQNYQFENWFIPYTTTLSLNWPYEPTDCLLQSSESEELMINPVFERHLRNLQNWSLGPMWAKAYPELVETAKIKGELRRASDEIPGGMMRS